MYLSLLESIIIFLLPNQLGLHFWPSFSRVVGIKIDYLSPTLYLLDIFLIIFVAANFSNIYKLISKNIKWAAIIATFALANILFSLSPLNSIFWWLRFLLYLLTFLSFKVRKLSWHKVKTPLLFSTYVVIFLQLIQTLTQHSVGGIFYWLGERSFSGSSVGLAHLSIKGLDFIRAYSTFSHPNSLAGYLVIVYFLLDHFKSPLWQKLLIFTGLLFTFSKAALFALAVTVLFKINPLSIIWLSLAFSLFQIFFVGFTSSWQFISDRLFLLAAVPKVIFQNLVTGVGLGNFVVALSRVVSGSFLIPSKLQPVHNLPYLFISEFGVVGVTLFIIFIRKLSRLLMKNRVLQLISIILLIGCFDHYFWTLPQDRLILLLALSLLL